MFSPSSSDSPLEKEDRCRACGHSLAGAAEPRCPHCGLGLDAARIEPTAPRPTLANWRLWVPGTVLVLAIGPLWIILGARWQSYGWAMTVVTPFALGILLGYLVHVRSLLLFAAGATLVLALAGAAFTLELAGLLCALILAGVLFFPLIAGAAVGALLRETVARRRHPPKPLTVLLLLVIPTALLYLEGRFPRSFPKESIQTVRLVASRPADLWRSLVFYEEVRQPPPAIARLGIPRPLYTQGLVRGEGDIKTCVYNKGRLVKRVTDYRPEQLLAFQVIEQVGVEDRSVRLTSGSFRFEPASGGMTRVVLTTRYVPKPPARPIWRPWERAVVSALHGHVLDEMVRRAGLPPVELP